VTRRVDYHRRRDLDANYLEKEFERFLICNKGEQVIFLRGLEAVGSPLVIIYFIHTGNIDWKFE
jgi:hypothetical protein